MPTFLRLLIGSFLFTPLVAVAQFRIDPNSSLGFRYRADRTDDRINRNLTEYQIRFFWEKTIRKNLALDVDAQSGGDTWSDGWDNALQTGDDSRGEFSLRVRRLFLVYQPTASTRFELGAMQSNPAGTVITPHAFDNDGWIDGLRGSWSIDLGPLQKADVTVGSLDTRHGNFYERDWDLKNTRLVQVQLTGKINSVIGLLVDFRDFTDHRMVRNQVNFNLKEVAATGAFYSLFETIVLEQVLSLTNGEKFNIFSATAFKSTDTWRLQLSAFTNDQPDYLRQFMFSPVRAPGAQGLLLYERSLNQSTRFILRARTCIEPTVCKNNSRVDFGFRTNLRR